MGRGETRPASSEREAGGSLGVGGPRGDTVGLLLRGAVTDEAVAAQLQSNFNGMVAGPVAALGVDDADRRSALISAQLLGIAISRHILRREPLASMPIDDIVAD